MVEHFFKQVTVLIVLSVSLKAVVLQVEPIALKIDAAAGIWGSLADGTITHYVNNAYYDTLVTDDMGKHTQSAAGYLYVSIKHPFSRLPDIRFEYVGVKGAGTIIDSPVPDIPFYDSTTHSEIFLTQYDTILFYNLFENIHNMTVDMGVDFKYVVSQYVIDDLYVNEKSDSIVPMLYLRGRVERVFSPLGFETDIKYSTNGTSTLYDIRAKFDYTLKMKGLFQPGIEVGYRVQKFKIDGEESSFLGDVFSLQTNTNLTFDGLYGGITVKF